MYGMFISLSMALLWLVYVATLNPVRGSYIPEGGEYGPEIGLILLSRSISMVSLHISR